MHVCAYTHTHESREGWSVQQNPLPPEPHPGSYKITVLLNISAFWGFPGGASGKESACKCRRQEVQVQSLGWEDPLAEVMATHFGILSWRIPWTEEPGGLQSIGLQRVGHD